MRTITAPPSEQLGHDHADVPGDPVDTSVEASRGRLRAPGLELLFVGVFGLFGWAVGTRRLSDNSFFWHLRTGRYMLEHGIPHADPFSFTAHGTRWIVQSWLAELGYGALDRVAGPFAIRLFGGVVGAAITVLTYLLARRITGDRVRASLVTVAALGGLYALWSERPLLLGALALVVLVWIVEVPDCAVGRHPVVALPILFWLWANVHGTFALGFAYLVLHLVGRRIDGARLTQGRERVLGIGSLVAFAVCFVNPYGPGLVTFPVALLARGDILRHIVEWGSPDFHSLRGEVLLVWLAVFVIVIARGRIRPSWRDLMVCLPFLALALWALRNVALAPLVCLPVVARGVAVDSENAERLRTESAVVSWALAATLVLVAVMFGVKAAGEPDFRLDGYPVRAMQAVERQGLLGERLLTNDADAGYVILAYGTRQPVFIDDRYDMYPRPVIRDFFALADASPRWSRILDRRKVDVVVWEHDEPLAQYLSDADGWTRTYRDRSFDVYVRDAKAG